jgi:hypothetical protein
MMRKTALIAELETMNNSKPLIGLLWTFYFFITYILCAIDLDGADAFVPKLSEMTPGNPLTDLHDQLKMAAIEMSDKVTEWSAYGIPLAVKRQTDPFLTMMMIKTAEYRLTHQNFGNSFQVANNNWRSIHYPVTADLLRRGTGSETSAARGLLAYYYNSGGAVKIAQAMRDFHNRVVKRRLIQQAVDALPRVKYLYMLDIANRQPR